MSRLTQWIEDAEAREHCLAASWQSAPARAVHDQPAVEINHHLPARVRDAAVQALSDRLRLRPLARSK